MDIGNKTAIIYITDNGLSLAERIKGLYPDAMIERFSSGAVHELWKENKNLIFIMATGIVVRTIAPLIKDKRTDPAVVVLDEKGDFAIGFLSGHLGGANDLAREIANFLGGEAVITTASDANNMTSIDLWAGDNNLAVEDWNLLPQIGTRLLNNGALRICLEQSAVSSQKSEIKLPDDFLKVSEPRFADVIITNKKDVYLKQASCSEGTECSANSCRVKAQLYLRPKNLAVGIGCNSGTSADEIENAVKTVVEENNLSFLSIHSIATIEIKGNEEGLRAFADKYGFTITTFTADELNTVEGVSKSDAVFKATGANAVSEPAALLASGSDKLIVPKQKIGNVTIAIAELVTPPLQHSNTPTIYIVGTGPGGIEHITPYAQNAIKKSDVIVGYGTYLDLIHALIKDKEVVSTGMTQEIERCKKAVELALSGKTVAVISGGDPGIYAMAGLVFEMLKNETEKRRNGETEKKEQHRTETSPIHRFTDSPIQIEVIPGISALNACAARLGAPLMHDFAAISLSDRLTPWELIEKRLAAAAESDFVTVIYNPKSIGRPEHINKARAIFLKHRSTETPVGIVKGAMRENESIRITNLRDMLNYDIDMQTAVIIGNSQTFIFDKWMVTPRGYENKYEI